MASAALAFRIFATDNASKVFKDIAGASDHLGGTLAGLGKVAGVTALGVTALGVAGAGAAVGLAAGVAGIAAATAGIGLAFAAQNSRVQQSFASLSSRVQGDMKHMSGVFVPVLLHLSDVLGGVFDRAKPRIQKAFAGLAPVAQKMVDGIGGALNGLVPAIDPAVKAATPLLGRLADAMPAVGRAAGRMVISVAGHMEALAPKIKAGLSRAEQAAKDGAARIGDGISTVLNSDAVGKVKAAWPGIVQTVTDGVTQMATAAKDRAIGVGSGLIDGFRTGLSTGNWSALGQTLGGLIRDQVGRALNIATTITEKLGEAIQKVKWFDLALQLGKQAPTLLAGLAVGLLNFDLGSLLSGLADHWQEVILGILAIAFTPAKIIGKLGELLAKIPIVGRLLRWIVEALSKFSKKAVGAVGDALGALGKGFTEGFRKIFPDIGASFSEHLKILPTRIGVIALEVAGKAKAMVTGLGNAIASGAHWVASKIGEIVGTILKPFAKAGGWLLGKGRDIVKGLANGISGAFSTVTDKVKPIGKKILGWVGDLSKTLLGAGKAVIEGLVNGIKASLGKVADVAGSIAGKVKGAFNKAMGIFSPSRVMAESGRFVMLGLQQGMESQYGQVLASVAGLAGSLSGPGMVAPALSGVPRRAGTGPLAGAGAGMHVTVNTTTNADPHMIASEVAWALRTSGR